MICQCCFYCALKNGQWPEPKNCSPGFMVSKEEIRILRRNFCNEWPRKRKPADISGKGKLHVFPRRNWHYLEVGFLVCGFSGTCAVCHSNQSYLSRLSFFFHHSYCNFDQHNPKIAYKLKN